MEGYIREAFVKYAGRPVKRPKIGGPEDVASFIRKVIKDKEREHVIALYLNGAHEVTDYSIVSIGTLNSSQIHPREVFKVAVVASSCAVILAHNHPSGQLIESEADLKVTREIKKAGEILGIKLLDHMIVTQKGHKSIMNSLIG